MLGHEIAHAFQIDIAKASRQNAFDLPGWFIEGMAEYLSLGPSNAFTTMWLRDAAIHRRLPTLEQLDDPRYFPYRYGHAFWSYLGESVSAMRSSARSCGRRRAACCRASRTPTGMTRDELTRDWHESISATTHDTDVVGDAARDHHVR